MVKKNVKKNNKRMPQPKKMKAQGNPSKVNGRAQRENEYRAAVLRMWSDPCAATPIRPPYAGMDSGYLVRTVDEITLGIGTAAASSSIFTDAVIQWTPSNYGTGTGYVSGINATGLNFTTTQNAGPGNFVGSNVVRDFRPVASCLQFVPSGPIATRSGTVSVLYSPNTEVLPATAYAASNITSICQVSHQNSTSPVEVNWLPTLSDERFTTVSEGNLTGRGTVLMVLRNVDATAGNAGAPWTINGFFRVTTIWEWTPAVGQGMTLDPVPPAPYTTQTILGAVKNVRDIIYGAVQMGRDLGIGFGANSGGRSYGPSLAF